MIWVIIGVAGAWRRRRGVCLVRGGVVANPSASRSGCRGCRRRSTGCGSAISPTSTSVRSSRAVTAPSERAAEWVASRSPELVCITGDLVSLPRGEARLRRIISLLDRPYRRTRQPRCRDHARPVLSGGRARGSRRCLPLARRGGHRRGSRGAGAAGRLRSHEARHADDDSLGARRHERPLQDPSLPLPDPRSESPGRDLRPHARRPSARRSDLHPAARRPPGDAGTPPRRARHGPLRLAGRPSARLPWNRNDACPVQALPVPRSPSSSFERWVTGTKSARSCLTGNGV